MFNSNRFRQRIAELESETARQQAVLQAIDRSMARVEFDLDCRIVASNENFQRVLGYSAEQLIGKDHRELCEPALVASPLYRQHWDKLRAGQPFSGRVKRLRADGSPVWLEATYNPIKDPSGRVTGFVKFASDVTLQVQEAMRDKAVLAAIDRSMAMVEFTPDGTITSANDNFLRAMGYAAGDLIGKHHRILCPPAFVNSDDYAALWRKLQGGQFFAGLVERVARDGSPRWLEASYNPVVDESGKVLAVIKTASDITARIQQQQEVRESVQLAFDTSQQTRQWANDGVGYITDSLDAVNGMARAIEQAGSDVRSLGEHSQQIGGIVQTIKEIADQTNLLALNAAIEAARAGEQGRGFAVVADEVRKLAERTSSSTDVISRMVGDIHQQTGTAVDSMENIQAQAAQSVEHFSKASEVMTQIRGGADAVVETVERVVNLRG